MYFHKRGSSTLLSSLSISPCIPVASTSSSTSYIESPNQKMGMASVHLSPTQSTFGVPIQSSSIGNGCSSGVNNGGNQFPIPHVYNSSISLRRTQDFFSDLEGEAIKSNFGSQVVGPCNYFSEEDYIFSKDLFTTMIRSRLLIILLASLLKNIFKDYLRVVVISTNHQKSV